MEHRKAVIAEADRVTGLFLDKLDDQRHKKEDPLCAKIPLTLGFSHRDFFPEDVEEDERLNGGKYSRTTGYYGKGPYVTEETMSTEDVSSSELPHGVFQISPDYPKLVEILADGLSAFSGDHTLTDAECRILERQWSLSEGSITPKGYTAKDKEDMPFGGYTIELDGDKFELPEGVHVTFATQG